MIPEPPLDLSSFVSDLPKPLHEFTNFRSTSQCENRFNIGDAIESSDRRCENFRPVRRTDQRILSIRMSKKMSGKDFDSLAGWFIGRRLIQ